MFGSREPFTTPQQELSHIANESQKRYILQKEGTRTLEAATRTTIEQYAQSQARDFLHESAVLPTHEAERIVLRLKPESHDKKIEELFGLMVEKGVKNALDTVKKMNDAHLRDDFHRFLVQYLHSIGALPGVKERESLYDELSHTLFSIALPQDEQSDFKKIAAAMEQFSTSLLTLIEPSQTVALELAVEHSRNDIVFYVAIPRTVIDGFEKLIHSFFPGAAVEEVVDDYNIFTTEAPALSGSLATLNDAPWKPLKIYTDFENDPFGATLGSLSQIAASGEGAAIQLVLSTPKQSINERNTHIITSAEKGNGTISDLFAEATAGIFKGVAKEVWSLFKKDEPKEDADKEKKIDTANIELFKKKNSTKIILSTLRILTSAQTPARAAHLRKSIEASFGQYTQTSGGNAMIWNERKGEALLELAGDFSFRRQDTTPLELSLGETASLIHFSATTTGPHELRANDTTSAPAPSTDSQKTDGVYLGTNTFHGQTTDVFLSKEDRVRHCYVIGQTGTGKTTILKNMAIQDIKNGNGVCFIDPHGNDLEDILANIPSERLDDVIYFDPAYTARPMGLNMLEYDINHPEQKIFVINELLGIFNKLFDMKTAGGPAFEQYFRNSAGLIMEDPESGSTLLEISRVLSDKAFRQMKLERCKNPIIKQFWENAEKTTGEASLANFVPYITNKFDPFVSNDIMRPVIAQQHSVLNFREIMDTKKILLVNLSKGRLGDINSHLIGLVLVGKLTMAALSRVDTLGKEAVNDFYLYIDEFQNVTTDSIATILSEARKYRLALTVAHQYVEQLEEKIKNAVFGNVGSMIIYRVSPENAAIFEQQLAPTFTPDDVLKLQNFNAFAKILVNGVPQKAFNLRIPPPPQGNSAIADKVKELSYLKYGRPREEVETEILARYTR